MTPTQAQDLKRLAETIENSSETTGFERRCATGINVLLAERAMLIEALKQMVESVTGVDQVSAVNEARAAIAQCEGNP